MWWWWWVECHHAIRVNQSYPSRVGRSWKYSVMERCVRPCWFVRLRKRLCARVRYLSVWEIHSSWDASVCSVISAIEVPRKGNLSWSGSAVEVSKRRLTAFSHCCSRMRRCSAGSLPCWTALRSIQMFSKRTKNQCWMFAAHLMLVSCFESCICVLYSRYCSS